MAGAVNRFKFFSKLLELFQWGSGGTAIGLSIGTSSIKLVELKKTGNAWQLLHFGLVQLPEDVIVNREIINQIKVVESIQSITSQLKLKNKSVCTSLSGTSLIIKRMTVEAPNLKELQDQVFWEAEQYLPFDVSEVVMDYQILSQTKDNKVEVLLVAVKRSVLDLYMNSIESSGLKAKIVDTDFFALQNLFEANYPIKSSESVAIIDMGASAMKAIVVHGGTPVFTKDTSMGGSNLTAEIQKQLNLSYADAEMLKVSGQTDATPQEVNDLMHIMSENFATEIKRLLDFYNASSTGAPIAYVLLGGGSSKIPGLTRIVEDLVGLPTQLVNPFNSISYDPGVFTPEYVAAIAPIAAVPIGLALRAGAQ
jgi:type IV pilus assembly protein PilM